MEHINTGNWSSNSFSGEVPEININFREPIKLNWDELDRVFAKVILKKRIEEAPKTIRDMSVFLAVGFAVVILSSIGIGEIYIGEPKLLAPFFMGYFVGIVIISFSIREMQEPLEIIRNKEKYEKHI